MNVHQRDIVELPFTLPQFRTPQFHPAIILSNDEAIEYENAFFAVMLSSTPQNDQYTLKLEENMFTKPNTKDYSEVRLHLIGFFKVSDISNNKNIAVKIEPFRRIVINIIERVINIDLNYQ